MNLPNIITIVRILLIPVFVVIFLMANSWSYLAAATLFALAAATDWLDGYLARKLNQTTPFGAFIDPVADKLIVVSALVILIAHHNSIWLTLPSLVIIGREIVISALREWMAETGKGAHMAVSYIGKVKTTMQMGSIVFLLATPPGTLIASLGLIMLYAAAALTLWSMMLYLSAAWTQLKKDM